MLAAMILDSFQIIDLSQSLTPEAPTWCGSCGFDLMTCKDYDQIFRVQKMTLQAGVGTHLDAPSHLVPGGLSVAELSLETLLVPLVIITVSAKADYEVSPSDIEAFEEIYGRIPEGSLVIVHTGWHRFWQDPIAYRNDHQFPALTASAAALLLERHVVGLGIDTLSPDCRDKSFPVHQLFLTAGKYIIENVGDCSRVPPIGSYALAFPLKIEAATEAPLRLVAIKGAGL